jgi:hypothetical protein
VEGKEGRVKLSLHGDCRGRRDSGGSRCAADARCQHGPCLSRRLLSVFQVQLLLFLPVNAFLRLMVSFSSVETHVWDHCSV